jgi:hypothetical protein
MNLKLNEFDPTLLGTFLELNILNFHRYFFKLNEGIKFIVNQHHTLISQTLMRVIRGEISRLIINIPPRYSKTELAVIAFMAYCFAINKYCRFLHVSYSDDLASLNSSRVKDIVLSDEFQALWPMNIRSDSKSKKRWNIIKGGGVYATSAEGQITGFGAGRATEGFQGALIIDDPIKPEDIHSDTIRQKRNEWINGTITSRLDNRNTPIILIMQRLHEEDTTGFLLNGGTGEMWHHLCLPVLID